MGDCIPPNFAIYNNLVSISALKFKKVIAIIASHFNFIINEYFSKYEALMYDLIGLTLLLALLLILVLALHLHYYCDPTFVWFVKKNWLSNNLLRVIEIEIKRILIDKICCFPLPLFALIFRTCYRKKKSNWNF